MHWRWYNPTNGQWTTEDPWGLKAGDANFRRYAGNNGANSTDPSGLEEKDEVSKTPQSDTIIYSDELIYFGGPFRRIQAYRDAINTLLEIHDEAKKPNSLIKLNIYYVTGTKQSVNMAKHVAQKASENSINYFYGHGTNVGDAFREIQDNLKGIKEKTSILVGMNCCYPGPTNNSIPVKNKLIVWEYEKLQMGTEDGTISEADALLRFFKDIQEIHKRVKMALEKKIALEVNIYFGSDVARAKLLMDPNASNPKKAALKETKGRFEYWEKRMRKE
jgi:hypothetical protein